MHAKPEMKKELLTWFSEMLETKKHGTFGIQIKMFDGLPVHIEKTDGMSYQKRNETFGSEG